MRMRMTEPAYMCRKHLLGEHVEHHMFMGSIKKGISMRGYLDNNLMQPEDLLNRHHELVAEMTKRWMNHRSPITEEEEDIFNKWLDSLPRAERKWKVKPLESLADLHHRCPECRERFKNKYGKSFELMYIYKPNSSTNTSL